MEKVIINPLVKYYIVSLKHTNRKDKYITLWRPKNAGYCWPLELAGVYDGYQHGYHNSGPTENVPVPAAEIPAKLLIKDGLGRECMANNRAAKTFIKQYMP